MHTVVESQHADVVHKSVVITGVVSAHYHQMEVLRQIGERLHNSHLIFPFLYGSHTYYIFLRQFVTFPHIVPHLVDFGVPEHRVAGLVDNPYFLFGHLQKFLQVAFGLLACGDDDIGVFARVTQFFVIDTAVGFVVKLGVAPVDKVVHCNHLFHIFGDTIGQLVAKSVVDFHPVGTEAEGNAAGAPEVREKAGKAFGHYNTEPPVHAEIVGVWAVVVGSVEDGRDIFARFGYAANKITAVVAQPGAVLECSFCVETNFHHRILVILRLQKYEKKSEFGT